MANMNFGYGDGVISFSTGGIDWSERILDWCDEQGVKPVPPVFAEFEDKVLELTPENYRIYINEVSDPHDCVSVRDPSDGMWFTMFREKFEAKGTDFEQFCRATGYAALTFNSLVPLASIVRQYEKQAWKDIEQAKGVPKEWME